LRSKLANESAQNWTGMSYNNFLQVYITPVLLLFILIITTEDCAGWRKDGVSSDPVFVAGGLDTDVKQARIDFISGWKSLENQDYDGAIYFFRQALNSDPEFPQAYYGMSIAFTRLIKVQEAIVFLDLALSKGASNGLFVQEVTEFRNNLNTITARWYIDNARNAMTNNRWSEAVLSLKNALVYLPDNNELKLLLAESLLNYHDYAESYKIYEEILGSESDSEPAFIGIIKACIGMNNYETAGSIIESFDPDRFEDEELHALIKHVRNRLNFKSLSDEYREALQKEAITRGDFAAFLTNILGHEIISQLSTPSVNIPDIVDISNHWAKDSILSILVGGLIEIYENSTFRPEKNLTRYELAEVIYNILNSLNIQTDSDDSSIYIPDVSTITPCYEIIRWVIGRRLMNLGSSQEFRLFGTVSGSEIMEILAKIKILITNS